MRRFVRTTRAEAVPEECAMAAEESKQPLAKNFDPRVFKLFDSYTHGFIDRRDSLILV